MVADYKEELVEASCNLLSIVFNYSPPLIPGTVPHTDDGDEVLPATVQVQKETGLGNLFLAYLARLHQANVCDSIILTCIQIICTIYLTCLIFLKDLDFLVKGFVRLIANPLKQV